MIATIRSGGKTYRIDLSGPLDISVPLQHGGALNAFHGPVPEITPVRMGSFTGSVSEGGSVNFNNVFFNPHSHCTHTECVGHIAKERIFIRDCLQQSFFHARLVTVEPQQVNGDLVLTKGLFRLSPGGAHTALIVRTLPNPVAKTATDHSGANPPYFEPEAAACFRDAGIEHLLTDLPSVDREEDGGELPAHRVFWNYPDKTRMHSTITELIYVPDAIMDGDYFLDLQAAPFLNDAAPSRPVLYRVL